MDLADKRRHDAAQAALLVNGPGWAWARETLEHARRRYLAAAFESSGTESHRLQAAAVAYFIDWFLELPEKRLAEVAAGSPLPAVDVLPRPPRSSESPMFA